jgi:hypothetical protein
MNFSIYQWLLTIVLDFILKAGLFYFLGAFTLGAVPISLLMSFALAFSMFHFFSLSVASGLVTLLKLARAAKFALTVIVAESLFTGGALLWTLYLESQDVSKCPGYVRSCPWSDISYRGIQTIVWTAIILLVLNLIPIAISAAFGCLASRIRRSLVKDCAKTVVSG